MIRAARLARAAHAVLAVVAGVTVGTLAMMTTGSSPSEAGTAGQIGLSRDGENWADWTPLFGAGTRWVPGDERRESFYVRNDGPTAGSLVVDLVIDDPDELLAAGHVELRARIGGGDWQRPQSGSAALHAASLEQGAAVRVDVEAAMSWDAPNSAMNDQLSIDIRATLSGVAGSRSPQRTGATPTRRYRCSGSRGPPPQVAAAAAVRSAPTAPSRPPARRSARCSKPASSRPATLSRSACGSASSPPLPPPTRDGAVRSCSR